MRPQRKSQAAHRTFGACARLAALLMLLSGCGVRANPHLTPAPLPLTDGQCAECLPTSDARPARAAPNWLVRCRRGWERWRQGESFPVADDSLVIPPSPRFHPVPTRPVFSPAPWETPPQAFDEPAAPIPLPSKRTAPLEEIPDPPAPLNPAPTDATPSDLTPSDSTPPDTTPADATPAETPLTPPVPSPEGAAPGRSEPAVKFVAPRAAKRIAQAPGRGSLTLPDAPHATEPLSETPPPQWRPRR